jgi:hypothetical protein
MEHSFAVSIKTKNIRPANALPGEKSLRNYVDGVGGALWRCGMMRFSGTINPGESNVGVP